MRVEIKVTVFRRFRNCFYSTIGLVKSARPYARSNSTPSGRLFIKFYIWGGRLLKCVENLIVWFKSDKSNSRLHEYLVKKLPAFDEKRRFITVFTGTTFPYPEPIQFHLSAILILSFRLRLGIPGSFSLRFPHQSPVHTCPLSHICPVIYPSVYFLFNPRNNIW